ncbi:MAG: sensor histidine kinase [Pseudomonadota bacterium]
MSDRIGLARRAAFLVGAVLLTVSGFWAPQMPAPLLTTLLGAGGFALALAAWAGGGLLAGVLVAALAGAIQAFALDTHPVVAGASLVEIALLWALVRLPSPPAPPLPIAFVFVTFVIVALLEWLIPVEIILAALQQRVAVDAVVVAAAVILLGDDGGEGDWETGLDGDRRRFALVFLFLAIPAVGLIHAEALTGKCVTEWLGIWSEHGLARSSVATAALLLWLALLWLAWRALDGRRASPAHSVFATTSRNRPPVEPHRAEPVLESQSGGAECLEQLGGSSDFLIALLSRRGERWRVRKASARLIGEGGGVGPASLLHDGPESLIHPADADAQRRLLERLDEADTADARYRLRVPEKGWRWYHVHGRRVPVAGSSDEQEQVLLVHVDITSVKETERQLVQSSKMATLGEMTAGVAHEINQPLNVIRLATQNLLRRVKAGSFDPEYYQGKLERVADQTRRAAAIIDHMRIFGRKPADDPEHFHPEVSVRRVADLLQPQLDADDIALHLDCDIPEVTVWGHESLFEQVMMNLLVNARDAINGNEQRRSREIFVLCSRSAENEIEIRVRDTGGGVPESVRERLFQPFFTTKPVGKGTGLGLSMSYGIVQDMNGEIAVRNVAGGAEFTLRFPAGEPL